MDLIQVFQNDKSATVSASAGSIGATVIKAKRGGINQFVSRKNKHREF